MTRPLSRLLFLARWHWWTDQTAMPEVSLLLRALGWLVQLARIAPGSYRSPALLRVVAVSSQDLWVGLLALVLAVVVLAYATGGLLWRAVASVCYIFWWGTMTLLLSRVGNTSLSIPDTAVSCLLAFWVFLRICHQIGLRHARELGAGRR